MGNYLFRRYGHIYFIQQQIPGNENEGLVKIGWSGNVEGRKGVLSTGSPYPLRVLVTIPGATITQERKLHAFYSSHRRNGEWFTPHEDILKMIREKSWGDIIGELKNQPTLAKMQKAWEEREERVTSVPLPAKIIHQAPSRQYIETPTGSDPQVMWQTYVSAGRQGIPMGKLIEWSPGWDEAIYIQANEMAMRGNISVGAFMAEALRREVERVGKIS